MADYSNSNFYNPDRGFRVWNRDEIVQLPGQTDKWVANVNDLVLDWAQGFFRVVEVIPGTNVAVLKPYTPPSSVSPDGDENLLIGVGPGYSSESYRCFLDTSVTPFTLAPDTRLHWYGSMVASYVVFKGSDISETYGQIVSAYYDSSNNYLGPNVPVEFYDAPGLASKTTSVPMVGFTNVAMDDNELVTLVAYDSLGGVVSKAQLLVMNTEAIRQADNSKSFVGGITLDTPFLSTSDPKVIEFPLNVMVASLPMQGVVHYRGGKTQRLPIGGQFEIFGLENYIATVEGEEFPMTASYKLAEDEISYDSIPTTQRTITENYIARTIAVDGAYSCRMFVYPNWQSTQLGYTLEFWLYNADRQRFYNCTPYVQLGTNSAPFQPKNYGTVQTLTYAVNLNEVDGRFAPYRFVTTFQLALLQSGDTTPNWEVYPRPDTVSGYGRNLKASVDYIQTNIWDLRLRNGANTFEEWLQRMYYAAEPLVDTQQEEFPPEPTHFILHFVHNQYKFSVTQWKDVLKVNNDLNNGQLLNIQWIKEMYDTDLQLALTAVPIEQVGP